MSLEAFSIELDHVQTLIAHRLDDYEARRVVRHDQVTDVMPRLCKVGHGETLDKLSVGTESLLDGAILVKVFEKLVVLPQLILKALAVSLTDG